MPKYRRPPCLPLIALYVVLPAINASTTGFPGTLPSSHLPPSHRHAAKTSAPTDAVRAGASSDDSEFDSSDYDEIPDVEEEMIENGAMQQGFVGGVEGKRMNGDVSVTETSDENDLSSLESPSASSQPLKTLQKLQHMLDSTDYITSNPHFPAGGEQTPFQNDETRPNQADGFEAEDSVKVMDHVANNRPVARDAARSNSKVTEPQFEQKQTPLTSESATVAPAASAPRPQSKPPLPAQDQLWTSKDRLKYKKQQQRLRREAERYRRRQIQSPPVHPNSSDDETTDGETEGDGLGYALPNLPVYYTDDEGGTTSDGLEIEPATKNVGPPPAQLEPHPNYAQQHQALNYPSHAYSRQSEAQAPPPYLGYPPVGSVPMPYPYGSYNPTQQQQQQLPQHQQQRQQQQNMYASQQQQHAAAWAASQHYGQPLYPPWPRSYVQSQPKASVPTPSTDGMETMSFEKIKKDATNKNMPEASTPMTQAVVHEDKVESLAEAGSMINFDSLQKISIMVVGIVLLCYCAVSPRSLELVDYNHRFKENIGIVSLVFVAPLINFLLVFDARHNDINTVISTLYTSFTAGYSFAFVLEIVLTTLLRLGVFAFWEPKIFELTPDVPALILPWVLRENRYRPKRITLFLADFVTSCVAAPIIEEYIKLKILQLSVRLPKNFKWTKRKPGKKSKKKRRMAEAIIRSPGEPEVTNINVYVAEMLAASLGIKLCDSVRRILMYTKENDLNKGFYAFCRGVFPIQELCGTMTALSLAKRDVLGMDVPLWRIIAPAVVVHGMANFRGVKPLFKWNSATPWSEMQLSPWNVADDSTPSQMLSKGFAQLMWLIILGRVLGYCIKNYYLISRKAVKRITTYAGKHAAFSAELTAAEVLKKTKD